MERRNFLALAGFTTGAIISTSASAEQVVVGANFNTLVEPGRYVISKGSFANQPFTDFTGGLLNIENFGGGWFKQTVCPLVEPSLEYTRIVRPKNGNFYDWHVSRQGAAAGKTVVVIGDSNTERGGNEGWTVQLASIIGANVIRLGFGGCRMGQHSLTGHGPLYDEMCFYKIARQIRSGDPSPILTAAEALASSVAYDDKIHQATLFASIDWSAVDWIVVWMGRNDFQSGLPLGMPDDALGKTFHGAINEGITNVQTAYKHIQFCLVTPLPSFDGPNNLGLVQRDYGSAIINRSERFGTRLADVGRYSGINEINWDELMSDPSHIKFPAGGRRIADIVASALR